MKAYPCHDRQKVEVSYDDGVDQITVAEAKKLIEQLQRSVQTVETRKTLPGPPPILNGEVGHAPENEEFAYCGPREKEGVHPHFTIAGHELRLADLITLRNWINKALKYHGVEK